jgi:hypothetical protein
MVVVVVGDDHRVERRELSDGDRDWLKAFGADEAARRDTPTPDRIGQDANAIDFEEQRRMA